MWQREKFTFVYGAHASIGVVAEFSESDFEAYALPDLAMVGAFRTKAQAAQALTSRSRQLRCDGGYARPHRAGRQLSEWLKEEPE